MRLHSAGTRYTRDTVPAEAPVPDEAFQNRGVTPGTPKTRYSGGCTGTSTWNCCAFLPGHPVPLKGGPPPAPAGGVDPRFDGLRGGVGGLSS